MWKIYRTIVLISCNNTSIKNETSKTDKNINKEEVKTVSSEKIVTEDTLQDIHSLFKEANDKFIYRGKPINPLAIKDLLTDLSDSRPTTVSIDLEGVYNSNRYFGEYDRDKDGWVDVKIKDEYSEGYFKYKRIGTLANNIHVIETADNGGGTGIFMDLLLIKFSIDTVYKNDGHKEPRMLINCKGEIGLCDRYKGKIIVKPTSIFIEKDKGYAKCRERDTIINFDN